MNEDVKPQWTEVSMAYEEAADHLERCAAQMVTEEEQGDKAAHLLVAKRIRAAGNRVKPTARPTEG